MSIPVEQDYDGALGVDLDSPMTKRTPAQSQRMRNHQFLQSGSIAARPGYKYGMTCPGSLGLALHIRPDAGLMTERTFVTGSSSPVKLSTGTFSIVYSGAATSVTAQVLVDETSNTWIFQIVEDGTEVASIDLGVGVDEVSPFTLAQLETAIEADADYVVTITGDNTVPAALLPQLVNQIFTGGPLTLAIEFWYSEDYRVPVGSSDLFANHHAARNTPFFKNSSFINFRECLIIATDEDYPVKFDGVSAYRLGMPLGVLTSATAAGAGAITANWRYVIRYYHRDARENDNPGSVSEIKSVSLVSDTHADLVIPTLQTSSGYATDYAKVNGAQAGVNTITVDAAHSLQIGDQVFLLNRAVSTIFGEYRLVTARTNTTVTIDGGVVTVADNDIISNGLSIEILRTQNNGANFYYVGDVPNDPSVASITFADSTVDANVGELFLFPDRQPDPPPKGGVIVLHQNVPFITRDPGAPNRLYYADLLYPEGFPAATNYRDLYSQKGGEISALAPTISGLEVFYPDSHYRLLGEVTEEIFSHRKVSLSVGCMSHSTVQELENGQIIWLTRLGPRWMGPGGIPQKPGFGLDSLFHEQVEENTQYWAMERALSVTLPNERLCLFFLPVESEQGGEVYCNENSVIWVFDYKMDGSPRWCGPWTDINMGGGAICDYLGRIHFLEKHFDAALANVTQNLLYFLTRGDDYDQVDHVNAIESEWAPGWEWAGNRTTKKVWDFIRLWSNDPNRLSGFTVRVRIERDFKEGSSTDNSFDLQLGGGGGAAGWQFEPWGFFPWGNPTENFREAKIPKGGAFALRPVFQHERLYEKPIFSFFGMSIKQPYVPGLARKQ